MREKKSVGCWGKTHRNAGTEGEIAQDVRGAIQRLMQSAHSIVGMLMLEGSVGDCVGVTHIILCVTLSSRGDGWEEDEGHKAY